MEEEATVGGIVDQMKMLGDAPHMMLMMSIIAGAGLAQFAELVRHGGLSSEAPLLLVGFVAATISGYVAIRMFLTYLRKRPLYPFAAYCVVVGVLALTVL